MIIYILGNLDGPVGCGYSNRMDSTIYQYFIYLKNNSSYQIELYDSSKIEDVINKIEKNDLFMMLAGCNLEEIKRIHCKKIYYLIDVHCRCNYLCDGDKDGCRSKKIVNYINENYDYLFYQYETYIIKKQFKNIPKFYFHYYFNPHFFHDYQLEKIYDILIYGNDWSRVYPFRYRLKNLIKNKLQNYRIKIIDHPDNDKNTKAIVKDELSKIINQSWITICTKSINNLLLKKYIESAMSKSVICGNYPDLEEKYFDDNMILLDDKMTDNEIITKIEYYLNNKNLLLKMSEENYKKCNELFTHQKGVEQFEKYITKIIS